MLPQLTHHKKIFVNKTVTGLDIFLCMQYIPEEQQRGQKMKKTCYRCGSRLTGSNSVLITGKNITVCRDCAEYEYNQCPSCKQYVTENDLAYVGSDLICIWCISEKFILCPHCNNFFPPEKTVKIHGYFVCRDCLKDYFKECKLCHNSVEKDEMMYTEINGNYEDICLKCWHENYFLCADCDDTYPKSEAHSYHGKLFCESCLKDAVSDDIRNGKLSLSYLKISNREAGRIIKTSASHYAEDSLEAFVEEGYADDYLGDGLDGKDNYLGDGLDE